MRTLAGAAAALGLLAILAVLGSLYDTFPGDLAVSTWVQSLRSDGLDFVMRGVSAPGASYGAVATTALAALVTFLMRGARPAGFLVAVAALELVVRVALKTAIARPRPTEELARIAIDTDSFSYPSGHVTFFVVLLGTLYVLLASPGLSGRTNRLILAVIAAALILTGFSRIYLGVHWLSDVLAGYVYAAALVGIAAWVWRRRAVS